MSLIAKHVPVSADFLLSTIVFTAVYVPNHIKSRKRRHGDANDPDDLKTNPMSEHYDPNLHDLLANMRRLDGTLPPHDKFGPPVNLIAPKGSRKYWIKSSTSAFGYLSIINSSNYMHYFCCNVPHCGNR